MNYSDMLKRDLVFLDVDAKNRQDLFHQIAAKLVARGYVKDSYERALNQREDEFPTGVVFPEISVMLPHADPQNVRQAFLAVVKVQKPVHILQMGYNTPEDAEAMFFLGITDSSQQVGLLQLFTDLLQNKQFVADFRRIDDPEAMYELVFNRINQ